MSEPLPDWPDQPDAPPDIGMDEIRAYWVAQGVLDSAIRCFKDPYYPCLPDWVQTVLVKFWKGFINAYDFKVGDVLNCYDFADGARLWANIAVAKANGPLPLAFFYIAYNRGGMQEHAVCGSMWRDRDRSLLVNFFEPQPTVTVGGFAEEVLKSVALTPDEIKSATDICY